MIVFYSCVIEKKVIFMLKSFFGNTASFGYKLFFPDQTKLAEAYGRAINSFDQTFDRGVNRVCEFLFPYLAGEEYKAAPQAPDEKYGNEPTGLRAFLMPHHSDDAQSQLEQNFERLGKIAEQRGLDTIEFAKNLGNAHDYLSEYISHYEIMNKSSLVGDDWGEIGKIETFFELLEDGIELPTSYEEILALRILKSKDEKTEMHNVELTLDDINKYMNTPEFDDAFNGLNQEVEASVERNQEAKSDLIPDIV